MAAGKEFDNIGNNGTQKKPYKDINYYLAFSKEMLRREYIKLAGIAEQYTSADPPSMTDALPGDPKTPLISALSKPGQTSVLPCIEQKTPAPGPTMPVGGIDPSHAQLIDEHFVQHTLDEWARKWRESCKRRLDAQEDQEEAEQETPQTALKRAKKTPNGIGGRW